MAGAGVGARRLRYTVPNERCRLGVEEEGGVRGRGRYGDVVIPTKGAGLMSGKKAAYVAGAGAGARWLRYTVKSLFTMKGADLP